jgi:two-component system, cell cycle response regulator DivK
MAAVRGLTVLVVDDVADNREVYAQFLAFKGCRVEMAFDGNEAIAKALVLQPDVVVMDLGLPRMDGWEATRRLKADARTRGIPIVVLSAHAYRDAQERALAAGADCVLAKPMAPEELLHELTLAVATSPSARWAVPASDTHNG